MPNGGGDEGQRNALANQPQEYVGKMFQVLVFSLQKLMSWDCHHDIRTEKLISPNPVFNNACDNKSRVKQFLVFDPQILKSIL